MSTHAGLSTAQGSKTNTLGATCLPDAASLACCATAVQVRLRAYLCKWRWETARVVCLGGAVQRRGSSCALPSMLPLGKGPD